MILIINTMCSTASKTSNLKIKSLHILLPFLLSRLWVCIFTYWGHVQREYCRVYCWEGVKNWFLNPWTAYDSEWFLEIARSGYTEHTSAFFPLYPLLLRIAGPDEIRMALWGIIISNLAFGAALYLFYKLTEIDYGNKIARLAVWVLAFFPSGAFFSAVYTDSIFLLFMVGTFYFVRKNSWFKAGLMAFFASVTRNPGFLLFFALLIEYYKKDGFGRHNFKIKELIPIFFPLMGFFAFLFYTDLAFQKHFVLVTSHQDYHRSLSWPWTPIVKDLYNMLAGKATYHEWIAIPVTFFAFFLLVRHWRSQPISYSFFMVSIMLIHFTFYRAIPPYTVPIVRYLSSTFPFTQLIGCELGKMKRHRLIFWCLYLGLAAKESYAFGLKASIG